MSEVNTNFLGTVPEFYDRHLGPVIFEPYAKEFALRIGVEVGTSDLPVLELACGTGILTAQLRSQLPAAVHLIATDLNQPMIDYARSKFESEALEGIDWRAADASSLPFPSGAFAAVACQFGLMFVPDKEAAFREARRVLVNGGLLAISVWDSFAHNPFGRIAHETIGSFFATDPPNFYQVPFGFSDPNVLRRLLNANDFSDARFEWLTLEAHSSSARSLAIGLVRGNPVSTSIEDRGVELDEVIDRLEVALALEGGDNPFRSTMRALVITARAA